MNNAHWSFFIHVKIRIQILNENTWEKTSKRTHDASLFFFFSHFSIQLQISNKKSSWKQQIQWEKFTWIEFIHAYFYKTEEIYTLNLCFCMLFLCLLYWKNHLLYSFEYRSIRYSLGKQNSIQMSIFFSACLKWEIRS